MKRFLILTSLFLCAFIQAQTLSNGCVNDKEYITGFSNTNARRTFAEATNVCLNSRSGVLPKPLNKEENDFLATFAGSLNRNIDFWLGFEAFDYITNVTTAFGFIEGDFGFLGGIEPWASGQPDGLFSNLVLSDNSNIFEWETADGTTDNGIICERACTQVDTDSPTNSPTVNPTPQPTDKPTESPTKNPTEKPTKSPTKQPTGNPTFTAKPTSSPTVTVEEDSAIAIIAGSATVGITVFIIIVVSVFFIKKSSGSGNTPSTPVVKEIKVDVEKINNDIQVATPVVSSSVAKVDEDVATLDALVAANTPKAAPAAVDEDVATLDALVAANTVSPPVAADPARPQSAYLKSSALKPEGRKSIFAPSEEYMNKARKEKEKEKKKRETAQKNLDELDL